MNATIAAVSICLQKGLIRPLYLFWEMVELLKRPKCKSVAKKCLLLRLGMRWDEVTGRAKKASASSWGRWCSTISVLSFDPFFLFDHRESQERQHEGISPLLRRMLFNNHHCSLFWLLDPIFCSITWRVKNSNKMASASSWTAGDHQLYSKVLESNLFMGPESDHWLCLSLTH